MVLNVFFSNTIDTNCIVVKENCKMLNLDVKEWIFGLKKIDYNYKRDKNIILSFNEKSLNIKKEYKELEKIYEENIYG